MHLSVRPCCWSNIAHETQEAAESYLLLCTAQREGDRLHESLSAYFDCSSRQARTHHYSPAILSCMAPSRKLLSKWGFYSHNYHASHHKGRKFLRSSTAPLWFSFQSILHAKHIENPAPRCAVLPTPPHYLFAEVGRCLASSSPCNALSPGARASRALSQSTSKRGAIRFNTASSIHSFV